MANIKESPRVQRLYGLDRDQATGCWRVTMYDVEERHLTKAMPEEPRHMIGALLVIEDDVKRREVAS